MNLSSHLAKHFRDVHFGGNWTSVNLKDTLADINWKQANTKPGSVNTILALVYHINYYVSAVTKVLEGGPLEAKDQYSFDHPVIQSEEEWKNLKDKLFSDAEKFAVLIEQLPEDRLWEHFVDEKYGTYYRNLQGIIEHTHYHLGQIVIIKKILL